MFIKYNGSNVHALPYINTLALKEMRNPSRKNKTMIQSPQDVKWLRPGWNEFPRDAWEQNKENPAIQKMLKKGTIELLAHKAKIKVRTKDGKLKIVERMVGADDAPVRLRYFDEAMAINIAKGTFDRELLQRWMDEETRHKVKKVLGKQIEPLLNHASDDDDDEDNDVYEEDFD